MNKPTHKTPVEILTELHACPEGIDYVRDGNHTFGSAWLACEHGDWLLWYAAKCGRVDRKKIVFIACQCARLALPYTQDPRVKACIETTEAWTRGEATIEQVRAADAYVDTATYTAYVANETMRAQARHLAATYVIYASTNATNSAIYASNATYADNVGTYAAYVANAIYAATYAAAYAAASNATVDQIANAAAITRTKSQKQCADIVRQHLPTLH